MDLQKLNPIYDVKPDGTIDPFGEKKIVKTSRGLLSIKIFDGYVGKVPQYVTFTCSYYFKGKFIDVGKMLGLENSILKDSMDHSLIKIDTWESHESMCDPCLRLDGLSYERLFIEDIRIKFMIMLNAV